MICCAEIGTARQGMWPGWYATCTKPTPRFIPVGATSSHRGWFAWGRKALPCVERTSPHNKDISGPA